MISAGFCHLLGDAIDQLTRSIKYPLAPFLCACGFMSTLIADQIVEAANHHPPDIPVLVRWRLQPCRHAATVGASLGGAAPAQLESRLVADLQHVAQAEGELQMLNTLAGSTPSAHSPRRHHHHCFGAAVQQVTFRAKVASVAIICI